MIQSNPTEYNSLYLQNPNDRTKEPTFCIRKTIDNAKNGGTHEVTTMGEKCAPRRLLGQLVDDHYATNSKIIMKGGNQKHFCTDDEINGNKRMTCKKNGNDDNIGSLEEFIIENNGDGTVSIIGGREGKYCIDTKDGIRCIASDKMLANAKYRMEITIDKETGRKKMSLIGGREGKYCADEGDRVKCNRKKRHDWETFDMATVW